MRAFVVFSLLAVGACNGAEDRPEPTLVLTRPALAETDQQPAGVLQVGATRLSDVTASARRGSATFVVTADGELAKITGETRTQLLDRAIGRPAALADGSVVVARRSDEPGETDLWLVDEHGAARTLAPAPGPDDLPIAIPDGRVAFVSARTGIASIWIVDPAVGAATQLTNRGLVVGGARTNFVPPPNEVISATNDHVEYDAGGGEIWRVALDDGAARRSGRRAQ
jgi:hypothetical protein